MANVKTTKLSKTLATVPAKRKSSGKISDGKEEKLLSLKALKELQPSLNCCVHFEEVKSRDELLVALLRMLHAHYVSGGKLLKPQKLELGNSIICIQTNGHGYFDVVVFGTRETYIEDIIARSVAQAVDVDD